MKKSLLSNSFLYAIKTICSMLFPLITFPYISRVLLDTGVGIFNFSVSFVSYFQLLASLGIYTYGVRECAKIRDNGEQLRSVSSELFTINIISAIVAMVALMLCMLIPAIQNYRVIIAIMAISIPLNAMGMEWIFSACEEYFYITVRYIVFQVASIILMFLVVKTAEDVWKYAAINIFATQGANIINFILIMKNVRVKLTLKKSMLSHIKPIMILFASAIAAQIYVNSDVLILGLIKGDSEVGIYSAASKVYNLVRGLFSAVIAVVTPRLIFNKNNRSHEEFKSFLYSITDIFIALLVPAACGVFLLSNDIVLLLSGEAFEAATAPLCILSVSLFFSCFGAFFASTVLLICFKEHVMLIATIVGAIVNLVLNFFIIPYLGYTGAAFTTLISEIAAFYIQFLYSKKLSGIKITSKNTVKSFFAAAVMCVAIVAVRMILGQITNYSMVKVFLCVTCGMLVYGIFLLISKHSIIIYLLKTVIRRKK